MGLRAQNESVPTDGFALPVHLAHPILAAARTPYPATVIRPLLRALRIRRPQLHRRAQLKGAAPTGEIAWSTHPQSWTALYRTRRLRGRRSAARAHTRHRVTPYLWDAAEFAPADGYAQRFIRDAATLRHSQRRRHFVCTTARPDTSRSRSIPTNSPVRRRAPPGGLGAPGRPHADRHGAARRRAFLARREVGARKRADPPPDAAANATASSSPRAE